MRRYGFETLACVIQQSGTTQGHADLALRGELLVQALEYAENHFQH
jgi:hypothetical protein